jgi:hypothetical protein
MLSMIGMAQAMKQTICGGIMSRHIARGLYATVFMVMPLVMFSLLISTTSIGAILLASLCLPDDLGTLSWGISLVVASPVLSFLTAFLSAMTLCGISLLTSSRRQKNS